MTSLATTAIELLLEAPFYAHLLGGLCRTFSAEKTKTMALAAGEGYFQLYLNPDFWEQGGEERKARLKHNLLHLVFRHPVEAGSFADRFLYDLAADLVVNQFLSEKERWPGAVTVEQFAGLGLQRGGSTHSYYEQLAAAGDSKELQALRARAGEVFEEHAWWSAFAEASSDGGQEVVRMNLDHLLRNARERAGTLAVGQLPGELQRLIATEPKQDLEIDWRRALRLFAGKSRETVLKSTIHHPSKRYGTTPGLRVKRRQHLLVGFDTSGSVDAEDLAAFFRELFAIWRTGAQITVVEFDAEIQRTYSFRGRPDSKVRGGGGTSFLPLLRFASRQATAGGLIVFTDGFAPTPLLPLRLPVLWVISARGVAKDSPLFRNLPGRKVKMNPSA